MTGVQTCALPICENFLVGTAVDFKQPFLLNSSDGELHAIGEALTLGLELDVYKRQVPRRTRLCVRMWLRGGARL